MGVPRELSPCHCSCCIFVTPCIASTEEIKEVKNIFRLRRLSYVFDYPVIRCFITQGLRILEYVSRDIMLLNFLELFLYDDALCSFSSNVANLAASASGRLTSTTLASRQARHTTLLGPSTIRQQATGTAITTPAFEQHHRHGHRTTYEHSQSQRCHATTNYAERKHFLYRSARPSIAIATGFDVDEQRSRCRRATEAELCGVCEFVGVAAAEFLLATVDVEESLGESAAEDAVRRVGDSSRYDTELKTERETCGWFYFLRGRFLLTLHTDIVRSRTVQFLR